MEPSLGEAAGEPRGALAELGIADPDVALDERLGVRIPLGGVEQAEGQVHSGYNPSAASAPTAHAFAIPWSMLSPLASETRSAAAKASPVPGGSPSTFFGGSARVIDPATAATAPRLPRVSTTTS